MVDPLFSSAFIASRVYRNIISVTHSCAASSIRVQRLASTSPSSVTPLRPASQRHLPTIGFTETGDFETRRLLRQGRKRRRSTTKRTTTTTTTTAKLTTEVAETMISDVYENGDTIPATMGRGTKGNLLHLLR